MLFKLKDESYRYNIDIFILQYNNGNAQIFRNKD